ncbi:MAG TPA: prepilin-type N-terminal cleavage/methylation domain-containing protein [Solirubrobacteraceae bacterium]
MNLRDEQGMTLVELLAAAAIFVVVMAATLTTLDIFTTETVRADRRIATEQQARIVTNTMARQLRNLASPTPGRPQAIDKATPYDLVFQSVDPVGPNAGANSSNVHRLRYCLSSNQRVYQQTQTWTQSATPAAPASAACPDPDARWTSTKVVTRNVVNRIAGQERPAWLYNSAVTTDISFIRTTLVLDLKPGSVLGETTLSTGVFLRNQNRAPIAAFSATPTGNRHVLLNGSISTDPEGEPLLYTWYDGGTAIGGGVTLDYVAPAIGTRTLSLKVTDPGGLDDEADPQQVVVS